MEISCNKCKYCKKAFSAEVLVGERMLYLKTWKVNTTQSNKTLPTFSRWCPAPSCAADRRGGMADRRAMLPAGMRAFTGGHGFGKAACQTRHRMTTDWSSSVVRYPECGSEWFGKREGLQWEGRKEGRSAKRRREKLCLTSRLCHLIERQYSLIYQELSFNKSKAFIQISYSSTHCWALLAVKLSRSSTQRCLKKAEGRLMLHFLHWLSLKEIQIYACAIFLLDLDGGWYGQAWRTRMWKVSSLGDGLYFAHILPRKKPNLNKTKQKHCKPLADGFLTVLSLWICSKAGFQM